MDCQKCGKHEPQHIMLLPVQNPGDSPGWLVCEECGRKSGAFCEKHNSIHQGFIDGTTACLRCIEEMVASRANDAEGIREKIWEFLSKPDRDVLDDAAEVAAEIMGCSESMAVLRFVASKALRTHQTVDDVAYQVTEPGRYPISYILW
jgi:hypothetical protein